MVRLTGWSDGLNGKCPGCSGAGKGPSHLIFPPEQPGFHANESTRYSVVHCTIPFGEKFSFHPDLFQWHWKQARAWLRR